MSTYSVTRLSITVEGTYEEFRRRLHDAVPTLDAKRLAGFVERKAPWDEVVADANANAPFGFFVFWMLDVDPSMSLNGNTARCSEYLIGNHTIAERMFRIDPAAMLYVPLRAVIYQLSGDSVRFVIEQPSTMLSSLGSDPIERIGLELDQKLATLFAHLQIPVPKELAEPSKIVSDRLAFASGHLI
jgi:uncharacterized protein (DUF302 family)